MRRIGVVTGSRADYGIYLPLLQDIGSDPSLELILFVTGMHLSPELGSTWKLIEADGFRITERVETIVSSDTPQGIAKSMGLGTIGFAQVFNRERPDVLFVLGDRFEMHAAAVAALPFKIPLAHIHGGESTEGAFDESLRHSITKLSHLHFASTKMYAHRLCHMGEEPWRITMSGALSLDNLRRITLMTREELEQLININLHKPPFLVTFHPVTLQYEEAQWHVRQMLKALEDFRSPIIFTLPNADTSGRLIRKELEAFVSNHPSAVLVNNLGTRAYFSLMMIAAVMIGNSSSGIIEAMSCSLPVVNIGDRQAGRLKPSNVIDVGYSQEEIVSGIRQAVAPDAREKLKGQVNPYGDGHAASVILKKMKEVPLDARLLQKRFHSEEHVLSQVEA